MIDPILSVYILNTNLTIFVRYDGSTPEYPVISTISDKHSFRFVKVSEGFESGKRHLYIIKVADFHRAKKLKCGVDKMPICLYSARKHPQN